MDHIFKNIVKMSGRQHKSVHYTRNFTFLSFYQNLHVFLKQSVLSIVVGSYIQVTL